MEKVVGVVLINDENKLLFHLRDNISSIPYPGTWAMIGGHVEKGETLIRALRREVKEEIGYNLRKVNLVGSFDDLVGNIVKIYKSRIKKDIKSLKLTEGQKLGFFSFEELNDLNVPKVLKDFLLKNKNKIFN